MSGGNGVHVITELEVDFTITHHNKQVAIA